MKKKKIIYGRLNFLISVLLVALVLEFWIEIQFEIRIWSKIKKKTKNFWKIEM